MRKRASSRLIILNQQGDVLLFRFVFDDGPLKGQDFWSTPGGGLEGDESFEEAASRELFEETGIRKKVADEIAQRTTIFQMPTGEFVEADERYFCVMGNDCTIDQSNQSIQESEVIRDFYWWNTTELRQTKQTIFPENLLEIMDKIPNVSG